MRQDTGNKQCQICHGYLFEDDDVVVCPECGAPHHRDCWQSVGHCGAEAYHGTDQQYGKQTAHSYTAAYEESGSQYERMCHHCGRKAKATDALFCPYCGKQYGSQPRREQHNDGHTDEHQGGPNILFGGLGANNNSYGGIPKDSEIEGIKVEKVAKFVGSNAHRYIPRFAVMKKSNRHSWNWAAFLCPSAWCISRKMYLTGIMYFILLLASSLCFVPFVQVLNTFVTEEMATQNYYAYAESIMEIIKENYAAFGWPAFALVGVGLALFIVPRIICAKTADWTYRNFALGKIRTILDNPEVDDIDETLMCSGSVNVLLMMITILAQQYLPSIIAMFIW